MACDAQQRGPQTNLHGNKGKKKQLSQFEAAFADVVEHIDEEHEVENSQRLQNLATSMEWSMIESECKQLAAQVRFRKLYLLHRVPQHLLPLPPPIEQPRASTFLFACYRSK